MAARKSRTSGPTQVVLLDGQPAVRAGVRVVVSAEPDLQVVGAATAKPNCGRCSAPSSESDEPQVVVAAAIAGAAAIVSKESPTAELIAVIRTVARDPGRCRGSRSRWVVTAMAVRLARMPVDRFRAEKVGQPAAAAAEGLCSPN